MSHRYLQPSDTGGVEYRLDGGLFNLRRLLAKAKTSSALISALQYANYAVFLSLTAGRLQHIHDDISETYLRVGHMVNTTRTEVLSHVMAKLFR